MQTADPILAQITSAFRAAPILAAEFTVGSKSRSASVTISSIDPAGGSRTALSRHEVAGKREARAIAKTLGATPWNF